MKRLSPAAHPSEDDEVSTHDGGRVAGASGGRFAGDRGRVQEVDICALYVQEQSPKKRKTNKKPKTTTVVVVLRVVCVGLE